MVERLNELWQEPGFPQMLGTFESSAQSMSMYLDIDTKVSISTKDGEPYHSVLKTMDLFARENLDRPPSFEELFHLYHAATIADPDNPLTNILKSKVLDGINNIVCSLDRVIESANILKAQVENRLQSDAWEVSRQAYLKKHPQKTTQP